MPPAKKAKGSGTARSSSQGSRQRAAGSDSDAQIGQFAQVVSGPYAGLYGVVQGVEGVKDGVPTTADFEIRSRPQPGLEIPETGNGHISVEWGDLRRSVAGLR